MPEFIPTHLATIPRDTDGEPSMGTADL